MKFFKYVIFIAITSFNLVHAEIVKETMFVPVKVKNLFSETEHKVGVVVWHDTEKSNTPFIVVNHGRSPNPNYDKSFIDQKTGELTYASFPGYAKYFLKLGFTVLVPTRIGYGATGGADHELCNGNYMHDIAELMADQAVATVKLAQRLPYVNPSKGVITGASMGGAMTVAAGARNIPGIVAYVNFSGGIAGKSSGGLWNERGLHNLFADYGKVTKIPSLWLYGDKDHYFDDKSAEWFEDFKKGGSDARFIMLKGTGHYVMSNIKLWRKDVELFLKEKDVI